MSGRTKAAEVAVTAGTNEVLIGGRVSAAPEERELPSGDVVWNFRVIVDRPPGRRPSRVTVDVVDCAVWGGRARRTVRGLRPGDQVEVRGALRRRFFRAAAGAASRVEVEVAQVRIIRRAGSA